MLDLVIFCFRTPDRRVAICPMFLLWSVLSLTLWHQGLVQSGSTSIWSGTPGTFPMKLMTRLEMLRFLWWLIYAIYVLHGWRWKGGWIRIDQYRSISKYIKIIQHFSHKDPHWTVCGALFGAGNPNVIQVVGLERCQINHLSAIPQAQRAGGGGSTKLGVEFVWRVYGLHVYISALNYVQCINKS